MSYFNIINNDIKIIIFSYIDDYYKISLLDIKVLSNPKFYIYGLLFRYKDLNIKLLNKYNKFNNHNSIFTNIEIYKRLIYKLDFNKDYIYNNSILFNPSLNTEKLNNSILFNFSLNEQKYNDINDCLNMKYEDIIFENIIRMHIDSKNLLYNLYIEYRDNDDFELLYSNIDKKQLFNIIYLLYI